MSKTERSRVMRCVRSKGNKSTELKVIELFREAKLKGWRRNKALAGKPDFVFPEARIALFVDGCFWHGCPYCYRAPKTNKPYWSLKVERNKKRDLTVNEILAAKGWKVYRLWECELKTKVTTRLIRKIRKRNDRKSQ